VKPSEITDATFFPDGFLAEGCVEGYSSLFFFLSWQWMKRLSMNELLKIILRSF